MKKCKFVLRAWLLLIVAGCGMMEEGKPKNAPFGLITTPVSYYSTSKARYLGDKYKTNLDRLVERIVRNPKTASLQFANNIASVGGIGFFTHSAATTPDERYLEIVLAAPETFETGGDHSGKLHQLFTSYGIELLSILASDSDIYQEKDVSGYGLNLSWRNVVHEGNGPRVTLERAVAYFPKQKVRGFLRQEISQNDLLQVAVIFAVEEDGPMRLVTYTPVEPQPDFRPPIREQTLTDTPVEQRAEAKAATPLLSAPQTVQTAQVDKQAADSTNGPRRSIEKTPISAQEEARIERREQGAANSSAREEKAVASNPAANEAISETVKANEVVAESVEPSPVASKLPQIQKPSADTVLPKIEVMSGPLPSPTETAQAAPNVASKGSASGAQMATDEGAVGTRLPPDKPNQSVTTPEAIAKNIEKTDTERRSPELRAPANIQGVGSPEPRAVVPARKPEAPALLQSPGVAEIRLKEEILPEAKSQSPVVKETKPEKETKLDARLSDKTIELKTAGSQAETKAPAVLPFTVPSGANSSDAKIESPVPAKEADVAALKPSTPSMEKTPERLIVASQPETQAAAGSRPPVVKDIPSKDDAASKSPAVTKSDGLKTLEPPEVVQERPIVALKPAVKPAPVAPPSSVELPLAKEEKGSKTDRPGTVTANTEIPRVPALGAPIESRKPAPPVVALKSEPEPVIVVQPVDPKVNAAAKESSNQAQPSGIAMAQAEAVKMPDAVTSRQETKPETAVVAPKIEAKTPDVTIQTQVAVREKELQSLSSLGATQEHPRPRISSPEVGAPTRPQPSAVPAPITQVEIKEKPATEQVASLAKQPAEISTEQEPVPFLRSDVKAQEVMPPAAQVGPAAEAKASEKPANEQIALLTKRPAEVIPEKKPLPRSAPKALEGYIIQLSFSERGEAQRWAEKLTAQGYAVSITEAGNSVFRVRIGNFAVRPEAERRLKTLGQQGLKGIVLNLPQAYRPDASPSAEATADTVSVTP